MAGMEPSRITCTIEPRRGRGSFDRLKWVTLVDRRPEFKRHPPRQISDPFTGHLVTVYATDDAAEVHLMGQAVGEAWWSASDGNGHELTTNLIPNARCNPPGQDHAIARPCSWPGRLA